MAGDDLIRTDEELPALFVDWHQTRNDYEASEWQRQHVGRLIASLRVALAERDALRQHMDKQVELWSQSGKRGAARDALLREMREALARHGRHSRYCDYEPPQFDHVGTQQTRGRACDCGWHAALARAAAELGEGK